ncbi:MAG: stage II sporulation protein M [Desulfomonile sp.]|nr:stage II sporulation protein M [Desulfomonile sp.]
MEWERLERIAEKFGPGRVPKLNRDELWELGRLYTAAVADLATLRSALVASPGESDLVTYLNGLVTRIHGLIYRKPPFRWPSLWRFFTAGFPGTVRSAWVYVAIAAGIFGFFAAAGFALGLKDGGFVELLVPPSIIGEVEKGRVWFADLYTAAPQASSFLMTHNVSVTFLIVASGITFGIGTIYLLALNGLLLGTVAALCLNHGLSMALWSFVLPHGSLELSAVILGGAAGLILGHALIDPGSFRRADVLSVRGREAGVIALGCVPLLVVAGIIEAFVSPSRLPAVAKLLLAGVLFVLLVAFLTVSGSETTPKHPMTKESQKARESM